MSGYGAPNVIVSYAGDPVSYAAMQHTVAQSRMLGNIAAHEGAQTGLLQSVVSQGQAQTEQLAELVYQQALANKLAGASFVADIVQVGLLRQQNKLMQQQLHSLQRQSELMQVQVMEIQAVRESLGVLAEIESQARDAVVDIATNMRRQKELRNYIFRLRELVDRAAGIGDTTLQLSALYTAVLPHVRGDISDADFDEIPDKKFFLEARKTLDSLNQSTIGAVPEDTRTALDAFMRARFLSVFFQQEADKVRAMAKSADDAKKAESSLSEALAKEEKNLRDRYGSKIQDRLYTTAAKAAQKRISPYVVVILALIVSAIGFSTTGFYKQDQKLGFIAGGVAGLLVISWGYLYAAVRERGMKKLRQNVTDSVVDEMKQTDQEYLYVKRAVDEDIRQKREAVLAPLRATVERLKKEFAIINPTPTSLIALAKMYDKQAAELERQYPEFGKGADALGGEA